MDRSAHRQTRVKRRASTTPLTSLFYSHTIMSVTVTTQEIAESLQVRIAAVREELERFDALRAELVRLESALGDLQPDGPEQPRQRPGRAPKPSPSKTRRAPASRKAPTKPAVARRTRSSAKPRARSSQTRDRIIDFIRAQGPATAGEVATGLGLQRNSVATRLTQLAKSGDLVKEERGYGTPAANGASNS